jgi:hypothetical protein
MIPRAGTWSSTSMHGLPCHKPQARLQQDTRHPGAPKTMTRLLLVGTVSENKL